MNSQKLREELDRVFSIHTRLKYADHSGFCECYTCGIRIPWQEVDAGHFIRRAHSAVRYHEDNVKPQCVECNRSRGGMEESFEEHLRDDLGDEAVDNLLKLGVSEKHFIEDEYREQISKYKAEIKKRGVNI